MGHYYPATGGAFSSGHPGLIEKTSEYGIDDQVYFVGFVRVEELVYLYAKAKMMVFPSLFEGFGIPLVEAMAVGCPVLASNNISLPEVGGDTVEFFDPLSHQSIGEAIAKVWHDTNLREKLIRKGKVRAQHFTSQKLAYNHLKAFQESVESFSMFRYCWNN